MDKEKVKIIYINTIKYLKEYLEILKKENEQKGILLSGDEANITQLIMIFESELDKVKEGKYE